MAWLADGSISEMEVIRKTTMNNYFTLLKHKKDLIERQNEALEKQKSDA